MTGAWRIRMEPYMGWVVAAVVAVAALAAGLLAVELLGPSGEAPVPTTRPARTLTDVLADPATPPACREVLVKLRDKQEVRPAAPSPAAAQDDELHKLFGVGTDVAARLDAVSEVCAPATTAGG